MREAKVFAPGTVANLGPGFDVLGLALERPGDTVIARSVEAPGVRIVSVDDDVGTIPMEAERNTAGIAAIEVLKRTGVETGIELSLMKGMPIGSGLGSSAASAAAAAVAVNEVLERPLKPEDLIVCCVEAEAAVSGRHADNVAPAILGGCVLVRSLDPLDVQRLPVPHGLHAVVVTPGFELSTRLAREALPKSVRLETVVHNHANLAALIHAFHTGDLELLARALKDEIVTPAREPLIPGCETVINAALGAGALGSSISGAGPSVFALCASKSDAQTAGEAMIAGFKTAGLPATAVVSPADSRGARLL